MAALDFVAPVSVFSRQLFSARSSVFPERNLVLSSPRPAWVNHAGSLAAGAYRDLSGPGRLAGIVGPRALAALVFRISLSSGGDRSLQARECCKWRTDRKST